MTTPRLRFQRANFIVRDIDRALPFYRDVLGFSVDFIKESEKSSYSYPVFEIDRNAKLRFAVLSAPDQPRVLALTEIADIDLAPMPLPRRAAIVLNVDDVDAVTTGAKAAGCSVYPEERLETQDGRIGREVGIADRDGNLVVIYKILQHPGTEGGSPS
mgnify:CR=1 FL=1